jgi:hypothetical protein
VSPAQALARLPQIVAGLVASNKALAVTSLLLWFVAIVSSSEVLLDIG